MALSTKHASSSVPVGPVGMNITSKHYSFGNFQHAAAIYFLLTVPRCLYRTVSIYRTVLRVCKGGIASYARRTLRRGMRSQFYANCDSLSCKFVMGPCLETEAKCYSYAINSVRIAYLSLPVGAREARLDFVTVGFRDEK